MARAGSFGQLLKNYRHLAQCQRSGVEHRPRYGRAVAIGSIGTGLGKAQVDALVVGKGGV